ncbi:UNVERIFIED_CONTAM: Transcription factor HHO3 [Sesamum angustifolium]|uniref:Transcription factor HHO3 n=1 Tax=Sesamum angustifolium TaxID=2727405 RepID=A0AAW2RLL6_9LAMI
MMINTHNNTDISEKMQRCQDYIHALEEERRKIQVFQRELPLCLELVTQAIETCKQQLSGTTTECNLHGQSECSEQTSTPVFEEFIPIKRASSHSDGEEQESKKPTNESNACNKDGKNGNDKNSKKSDWLRSVQLWNQTPDPPPKEDSPRKVAVVEVTRNGGGGAFHPFKKEKSTAGGDGTANPPSQGPLNRPLPPASTSSTAETGGGGNKKEAKEGQSQRKARRCWSPELHRRFLQALQQLGGSHVATPKQIRELMKVDGLSNDEVKSHLQKYRLHTRRPNRSIQHNNNSNAQTPQFVVVGGIWVPPEYAAMATTSTSGEAAGVAASKGIYTPVAAPPPPPFQESPASSKQRQHKTCSHSDDRGSNSTEGGVQSCTRSTSSSTHTATA